MAEEIRQSTLDKMSNDNLKKSGYIRIAGFTKSDGTKVKSHIRKLDSTGGNTSNNTSEIVESYLDKALVHLNTAVRFLAPVDRLESIYDNVAAGEYEDAAIDALVLVVEGQVAGRTLSLANKLTKPLQRKVLRAAKKILSNQKAAAALRSIAISNKEKAVSATKAQLESLKKFTRDSLREMHKSSKSRISQANQKLNVGRNERYNAVLTDYGVGSVQGINRQLTKRLKEARKGHSGPDRREAQRYAYEQADEASKALRKAVEFKRISYDDALKISNNEKILHNMRVLKESGGNTVSRLKRRLESELADIRQLNGQNWKSWILDKI